MDSGNRKTRFFIKLLYVTFAISALALIFSVGALFYVQFLGTPSSVSISDSSLPNTETITYAESMSSVATAAEASAAGIIADSAKQTPVNSSVTEGSTSADAAPSGVTPAYVPEDLRSARDAIGLTDSRIAEIRNTHTSFFYYSHLSESEQRLYAEIYHIMTNLASEVYVSTDTAETLEKVQTCVMNDHPEIFYVSGYYSTRYTLGDQLVGYTFSGKYIYDENEINRRNTRIESYIADCLSGLPAAGDDYLRIKYIYEYIINRTSYDINSPDNQNICSVMMNGVSVCQGYAKTAQLLLSRAGIPCTLVIGTVRTENLSGPHAWNLVKSNGNWYYMDVTWGDASFQNGESVDYNIGYDYLLTTSADIAYSHTIGSVVSMPVCNHTEDNYYVREGAYFAEASMDAFAALATKKQAEGATFLTFKCASDDVYNTMITELITNGGIFNYVNKEPGQSLTYSRSAEQRSVTIWF